MPAEAAFSVTAKTRNGDLSTIRGDSYPEFAANLEAALGAEGAGLYLSEYRAAFGVTNPQGAAVAALQTAGVTAAPPASTLGGQQVGGFTPPAPVANAVPPTATYPGDCAHGRREYKDKPSARGPWNRWECALPYSAANKSARCAAINV